MSFIEQDLHSTHNSDHFYNQFLLGPRFVETLNGWQHVSVNKSCKLTVHPNLDIEQVTHQNKSITLIGYILDPDHPDASNNNIARTLLSEFSSTCQLINATGLLGGRWIVIASDAEKTILFNDALGLRQVFYTETDYLDEFWAASQPGILAPLLDLKIDTDAQSFIDSYEVRTCLEYRWPGTATAFKEIRHLLPNHYLDIRTGKDRRFWPVSRIERVSFENGIEKSIRILNGLMEAAYNRFDLVHGMTAGFDSRIVLAASRSFKKNITTTTIRQGRMPDDHCDLMVPARLLERLEIPHEIIKAAPYMSADFSKAFKENVFLAHDQYGPDAEAILKHFSRSKVVVTGSGAEVAREPFRKRIDANKGDFTAEDLAKLQFMGNNEFAVKMFSRWLRDIDDLHNVHLLDLFSWEQSHGNWLAETQLQFDFAWCDIFTPFNCRELLVSLLSIDEKYRKSPDYRVFRVLIEKMWPELLDEPINPHTNAENNRFCATWRNIKQIVKLRWVCR